MLTSLCPECDAAVHFTSLPDLGCRVTCLNCHSMLVVINSHPIELDWAFVEPIDTSNPGDERGTILRRR